MVVWNTIMIRGLVVLILLTNLLSTNCQEEEHADEQIETTKEGKPSYSFSYGVSDARTGDVKTVWESKDGDTVKGHYSVLEPDGSVRSVEYSVNPQSGFQAVVNTEAETKEPQRIGRSMQDKATMDYERFYEFSEDPSDEYYERKRTKRPFDATFSEYSMKKKPKYPIDLESSDYTHTFSIKHPRDESSLDGEPESHVGFNFDPNCKTKKKHSSNIDLDLKKKFHYSDSYKDSFEKYGDTSYDFEKYLKKYENGRYKPQQFEDVNVKPAASMKYTFPVLPPDMMPPENYYTDDIPPRHKKKKPSNKYRLPYHSEDLDEYVLVPKRKLKNPTRPVEPYDYREPEEEFDRPHYPSFDDSQDDRFLSAIRGTSLTSGGQKEVIRKVVKKRKPVINLLDVLDI